jgi:hypothetical protein
MDCMSSFKVMMSEIKKLLCWPERFFVSRKFALGFGKLRIDFVPVMKDLLLVKQIKNLLASWLVMCLRVNVLCPVCVLLSPRFWSEMANSEEEKILERFSPKRDRAFPKALQQLHQRRRQQEKVRDPFFENFGDKIFTFSLTT